MGGSEQKRARSTHNGRSHTYVNERDRRKSDGINMQACVTVCTCYGSVYNIHEYMQWMYLGMQRHRHASRCATVTHVTTCGIHVAYMARVYTTQSITSIFRILSRTHVYTCTEP